MDHLQKLRRQLSRHLYLLVVLDNLVLVELWWMNAAYWHIDATTWLPILVLTALVLPFAIILGSTRYFIQPIEAIWQAILHLSPTEHGVAAPSVEKLSVGREMVASLTAQLYQLVTLSEHGPDPTQSTSNVRAEFLLKNLPLPFFILGPDDNIVQSNQIAASYLGKELKDMVGSNFYSVLDMSFPSTNTLDEWLGQVRGNKATAINYWERARINTTSQSTTHYFDLAAYYNQDNQAGLETLLVLFDHTEEYSQDDQAVSFIALAVHELRTPVTLLRGYIEVLEEELAGQLSPELDSFLRKLQASAEQLTEFVNNILNVARVDDDQLVLQLRQEDPKAVINKAVEQMSLRARVRDIELEYKAPDNLPAVAMDRVSIQEVMSNLIDNAIKYSKDSKKIVITSSLTKENLVETSVQDWGVGISGSIIDNLFSKFYRDHRNRAQIGGTGLGLYLSKAIIRAHGGNIWVRSKEGQGSTFSFTLLPYDQLSAEQKAGTGDITRSAHGWIKNHSLYRR